MTKLERMVKLALNIEMFTGKAPGLGNDTMTRKVETRPHGLKTSVRDGRPFLPEQLSELDDKPKPSTDKKSLLSLFM
jgi:hypothetical protein